MLFPLTPFFLDLGLEVTHIHHSTDAVTSLHHLKGRVDFGKSLAVGDELVDLERAIAVVLYQLAHLRASLDTTKGASLPYTTGDKLEGCSTMC